MIQFTEEERERLRKRSKEYPETILKLKQNVKEIYEGEIIVPKSGIANWTLYYYCPDCSVHLQFDRNHPYAHQCPSCGKVFHGEPYDSSWWGLINSGNYNAVFAMAIIWLATGEKSYAEKATEILKAYAKYYPDYEVHGNIPYNGPGRSGAQTLDEANFQRTLAMAYDILSETMTEEDRCLMRDQMFLPGAEFLMEHRHRQLHNHEVIINSAIAVIGILFDRKDLTEAALYEKYGVLYQLEHGMLQNRMWFEGAFGYHFYALTSFYAFEKFALHTEYSQIRHPNYRKMMEMLCDYLEPDYGVPMLNDTNYGHFNHMKDLYEFPYRELGGEKLAFVLNTYYQDHSRDNLEAFLYGADQIESAEIPMKNYHTETGQYGHTVLRGADDRYLLLKHDSYGGEHDHYDRLGFSYLAYGHPVSRDLGTTGYGARMHYDYYKNTATHNTLVIGEENQAPVNARLSRYEEKDGAVYIEAVADWTEPYQMPDSFTIVQWSEENYRTVKMQRKLIWTDYYFIEVFVADGIPEGKTADWIMHIDGKLENVFENNHISVTGKSLPEAYFEKKPLKYLVGLQQFEADSAEGESWKNVYSDGSVQTSIYSLNNGQEMILAEGPNNPSTGTLSYLMERRYGNRLLAAHVIESWKEKEQISEVRFEHAEQLLKIEICMSDGKKKQYEVSV